MKYYRTIDTGILTIHPEPQARLYWYDHDFDRRSNLYFPQWTPIELSGYSLNSLSPLPNHARFTDRELDAILRFITMWSTAGDEGIMQLQVESAMEAGFNTDDSLAYR